MNIEFVSSEKMSAIQKEALDKLWSAVYPPTVVETLPGRFISWARPQWSILLWDQEEIVTRVGVVVREITQDGAPKRVGGIGGVMTHPERRGQGLASQGMREAAKILANELQVDYALLFCSPHLVAFYSHLLWQPFGGQVYVEQPEGKIEFSRNGAMVLDGKVPAPLSGVLDLNGLPW